MEEDPERQEQSCPEGVWFANQVSPSLPVTLGLLPSDHGKTINNACASVALLNIVNNVPEIELGENLRAFKDFTASFSPALRGDAVGNFEFVKDIHNSFAR
jgi:ubiquitin carboxyl-terminal hydrolase L5